jgi:hypothetical protein
MILVFPSPLFMPSKLLQVPKTPYDACRPDGEYLLSSPSFDQATHLLFLILGQPNFLDLLEGSIGEF